MIKNKQTRIGQKREWGRTEGKAEEMHTESETYSHTQNTHKNGIRNDRV